MDDAQTDVQVSATGMPGTDASVACRGLWKVYGSNAKKVVGSPDADLPRAELLAKTGCVVAVRDVSFEVAPG